MFKMSGRFNEVTPAELCVHLRPASLLQRASLNSILVKKWILHASGLRGGMAFRACLTQTQSVLWVFEKSGVTISRSPFLLLSRRDYCAP